MGLTFLLVVIGWVFFRATTLPLAGQYLLAMGGTRGLGPVTLSAWQGTLLVIAALASTTLPNAFEAFRRYAWKSWHAFAMSLVFGACLAVIVGNDASPFLYFQF